MFSIADMAVAGAVALLLFGPDQLPKVARRAGQLVRDVQNTSQSFIREMERAADDHDHRTVEPTAVASSTLSSAPAYHETPEPARHELVAMEAALDPHPGAAESVAHGATAHQSPPEAVPAESAYHSPPEGVRVESAHHSPPDGVPAESAQHSPPQGIRAESAHSSPEGGPSDFAPPSAGGAGVAHDSTHSSPGQVSP